MISRKSQVEMQLNCFLIPSVVEGEKEGFGVKKVTGAQNNGNKTRGIPHRAHAVLVRAKNKIRQNFVGISQRPPLFPLSPPLFRVGFSCWKSPPPSTNASKFRGGPPILLLFSPPSSCLQISRGKRTKDDETDENFPPTPLLPLHNTHPPPRN